MYIQKLCSSHAIRRSGKPNLDKHGFDLADFEVEFSFDRFVNLSTKPSRTGRERFKLIGTWFGETVVVVITSPLGSEAVDVISFRRADRKERAAYAEI